MTCSAPPFSQIHLSYEGCSTLGQTLSTSTNGICNDVQSLSDHPQLEFSPQGPTCTRTHCDCERRFGSTGKGDDSGETREFRNLRRLCSMIRKCVALTALAETLYLPLTFVHNRFPSIDSPFNLGLRNANASRSMASPGPV